MKEPSDPTTAPGVLPRVIRPRPLLLTELEELIAANHPFAQRLREQPGHVTTLATFLWARDAAARQRLSTKERLLDRLRRLLG